MRASRRALFSFVSTGAKSTVLTYHGAGFVGVRGDREGERERERERERQ